MNAAVGDVTGPPTPVAAALPPDSQLSRQTGGMLWLTAAMAIFVITGYAVTVLLARLLGPTGLGLYGVSVAIITVVQIVVARAIPAATSAELAAHPPLRAATRRVAWRAMLLAGGAIAGLLLLLNRPIAAALGDQALVVPLTIAAAVGLTYGTKELLLSFLNGEHRFGRQAIGEVAFSLARLVTIPLGAIHWGVRGALVGYVLAPLIGGLAALSVARPVAGPARGASPDAPVAAAVTVRSLLARALPMAGTATAISMLLVGDLLAFKRVGTDVDVGIYNAAETIAQVPFFLLNSAALVLLPSVASLAAASAAERRDVVRRGLADAWVLLALPTALLIVMGDSALAAIFGERFDARATVVAPLAIATAGITIYSILVAVESGLGRLREALMIGAVGFVAMAAAILLAGRGSNLTGAAWAVAAVATIVAVAHLLLVAVRLGRIIDLPRAAGATGLAAVLALACVPAPDTLAWISGCVVAACAVYALAALKLGLVRLRPPKPIAA